MRANTNVSKLFRFRDTSNSPDASSKRYVITNPPDDFAILSSDQVHIFILLEYEIMYTYYMYCASLLRKYNIIYCTPVSAMRTKNSHCLWGTPSQCL